MDVLQPKYSNRLGERVLFAAQGSRRMVDKRNPLLECRMHGRRSRPLGHARGLFQGLQ